MIKPFKELFNLDITASLEEKPDFEYDKVAGKTKASGKTFTYLNWAKCLELLYENGAETVKYHAICNDQGHSLFVFDGKCPEVRVFVQVDDKQDEFTYPLIKGSRVINMEKINQLDIHNAQQRAFVKGVAILTGLGLKVWQKEEEETTKQLDMDEDMHSIAVCVGRVEKLYAAKLKKLGSADKVNKSLGLTDKQIKNVIEGSKFLQKMESQLKAL